LQGQRTEEGQSLPAADASRQPHAEQDSGVATDTWFPRQQGQTAEEADRVGVPGEEGDPVRVPPVKRAAVINAEEHGEPTACWDGVKGQQPGQGRVRPVQHDPCEGECEGRQWEEEEGSTKDPSRFLFIFRFFCLHLKT